jgi:hypothetical protein
MRKSFITAAVLARRAGGQGAVGWYAPARATQIQARQGAVTDDVTLV